MRRSVWLVFVMVTLGRAGDVATFSMVAHDAANGDWGIAVASRYFSVGSVVPWAEAGIGAVATQANVNVGYGPRALELLKQGLTGKVTLDRLLEEDQFAGKDGRQVAIIDGKGNIAAYTGPKAQAWAGGRQGKTWSAQGNILAGPQVVEAMGRAFEQTAGELAEKLFAALQAGDDAGGDSRGRQSASLLVVRKGGGRNTNNDRYVYINVDDNAQPIPELRRLLDLNLGLLYQEKAFRLLGARKAVEAREASARVVRYMPARPEAHVILGVAQYAAGDKTAALEAFGRARALDPELRKRLEARTSTPSVRAIVEDAEFMKQLFPE